MTGQSNIPRIYPGTYIAGIYCRLSNEEAGDETSISITTQQQICTDFCRKNGIAVYDVFADDGWSGTNFDRPDFRRLITAIEDGQINTVIVKDMSRFGRNYLEVGSLITQFFPQHNVRFIAVNDDVDSEKECVDFDLMFPIRNFFNEYYPADCSKKVRAALTNMAQKGQYIGSRAPYGFCKSAADKHVLEIDPIAAPVVRQIFGWLAHSGYGGNKIAKLLEEEKVLRPDAYRAEQSGKTYTGDRYAWNVGTVLEIANNEVYLGHLYSGKRKKLSFKSKEIVKMPPEKQIIVRDIFPRIISDELWEEAHEAMKSRKRDTPSGFDNIFAGLLKCADCGHSMGITVRKGGKTATYNCEYFKKHGIGKCRNHHVQYAVIYDAVLNDIRNVWGEVVRDRTAFLQMTEENIRKGLSQTDSRIGMQEELKTLKERLGTLERHCEAIYEDRFSEKVNEQTFIRMIRKMEAEREDAEARISRLETSLASISQAEESAERFANMIAAYAEIPSLDRELLHRLIERIEIGSRKDETGKTHISIHIVYKFIGEVR